MTTLRLISSKAFNMSRGKREKYCQQQMVKSYVTILKLYQTNIVIYVKHEMIAGPQTEQLSSKLYFTCILCMYKEDSPLIK